jgi:tyrosinase
MRLDRRTVLAGLAAVGVAGLPLGSRATSAGAIRVRRSIADLRPDDPDIDALRRAIPLMRKSGAWAAQVAVHADMRNRQHTSWRFLPWHRMLLARFEATVAVFSGKADFALPYWDWGRDAFPRLFLEDPVFRMRNRTAPRDLVMDSGWFTAKLDDPFATYFGAPREGAGPDDITPRYVAGSAEWSGHNLAHGYIGGDMNDLQRAPNDPIFWLHHANIDRCWTLWRRRNPFEVYPQAWRDEVLSGFVAADGAPAPPTTAGAMIETLDFGYLYPHDGALPPVVDPHFRTQGGRGAHHAFTARALSDNAMAVEIPADIARRRATAVGFIEIECDPHRPSQVTVTAHRQADGAKVFHDTIFAVPMGLCFEAAAYRINLDRALETPAGGAVQLRVETGSIRGPRARFGGAVIRRAIIDIETTA